MVQLQIWLTPDVEVSGLLGWCELKSLSEYILMFRWIILPSCSGFFLGCLTLKKILRNAGKYLTNNTVSLLGRVGATRLLGTSPLGTLDVFVLKRKNLADVRRLSWPNAVIMLEVSSGGSAGGVGMDKPAPPTRRWFILHRYTQTLVYTLTIQAWPCVTAHV
jgi:hypothetical protein